MAGRKNDLVVRPRLDRNLCRPHPTARSGEGDTGRCLPGDGFELPPPIGARPDTLARAVDLFATASIAGGAAYDAWVALAALDNRALLASRDARAEITYRRLGVEVEMIT